MLRDAYREAGLALPAPPPPALVARVLLGAAAAIEFEAQLLRKAAFDGANVDSAHIRNLRGTSGSPSTSARRSAASCCGSSRTTPLSRRWRRPRATRTACSRWRRTSGG